MCYRPMTFLRIMVARLTLSATAAKSRGLGREMSSRASLTAAMIAAAIYNGGGEAVPLPLLGLPSVGSLHLAHSNSEANE
jgi:hypothetical protein